FFLLGYPGDVFLFRHRLDHHRHKAMVFTAQLSALATVYAGLVYAGPGLVDKAWDGIFLDTELGYPPGMNDIVGSEQKTHLLANRNHQWVIHFQQVILALGLAVLDLIPGCGEAGKIAEVVIDVRSEEHT